MPPESASRKRYYVRSYTDATASSGFALAREVGVPTEPSSPDVREEILFSAGLEDLVQEEWRLRARPREVSDEHRRGARTRFRNSDVASESRGDAPTLGEQLCLLDLDDFADDMSLSNTDISNAVIFSPKLLEDFTQRAMIPQYGLLGSGCQVDGVQPAPEVDRRMFLNTNVPWSTFICGVQGSGKSHTLSCLIENSLISAPVLGVLKHPLSALVFHFSQYTSRSNFRPCEAAFLARPSAEFRGYGSVRSVNVLVSPSNFCNLAHAYTQITGVRVHELKIHPKHLNVGFMLALMAVNQSESQPLYMAQVVQILRDMAGATTGDFDFADFKRRLRNTPFTVMQRRPLEQRMNLLESFLDLEGTSSCFNFGGGSVTVVDLSCPFVDENTACLLFNICLWIYLEGSSGTGKIIAVDEAHKYLNTTPSSKILTDSLLTVIRQQRHHGARVIVATQEPTVSPRLIGLCSMIMIHRFTSPDWFAVLRRHVSIIREEGEADKILKLIIELRVGEALVSAPLGVLADSSTGTLEKLGLRLLRIKVRKRLTWDGGKSIVCV